MDFVRFKKSVVEMMLICSAGGNAFFFRKVFWLDRVARPFIEIYEEHILLGSTHSRWHQNPRTLIKYLRVREHGKYLRKV